MLLVKNYGMAVTNLQLMEVSLIGLNMITTFFLQLISASFYYFLFFTVLFIIFYFSYSLFLGRV